MHEMKPWTINATSRGFNSVVARKKAFTHPPTTSPSFKTERGESRVGLIFHRGLIPPTINVGPAVLGSEHRPVTARISLSEIASLKAVPLSLMSNQRCRERAQELYKTSITHVILSLKRTFTAASLAINARRVAEPTIEPWEAIDLPCPARFRPGYTRALHTMAKRRKRLLKSKGADDKDRAQKLDRNIKRIFKRNKRRLEGQISDELANINPATDYSLIKKAFALDGSIEETPQQSDLDAFTSLMKRLKPPLTATLMVQIHPFEVPFSFFKNTYNRNANQVKAQKVSWTSLDMRVHVLTSTSTFPKQH